MPKLFRPEEARPVSSSGTRIDPGLAGSVGRGAGSIGSALTSAGRAMQSMANQGNLAAQQGQQMIAEGNKMFDQWAASHQTGLLADKLGEANLEFAKYKDQRYKQLTDEDGNPLFGQLTDDIGNEGRRIRDTIGKTIKDPKVLSEFNSKFDNFINDQQVYSVGEASRQQQDYSVRMLDEGLGKILKAGTMVDPSEIGTPMAQGIEIINKALEGGVINQQKHADMTNQFQQALRLGNYQNAILNNTQGAANLLSNSPQSLGITEQQHSKLNKDLDVKVASDVKQAMAASQEVMRHQEAQKGVLASELATRIDAGVLREDELLRMEPNLTPDSFKELKGKYVNAEKERQKKVKVITEVIESINRGEGGQNLGPSKIDQHYDWLVEAEAQRSGVQPNMAMKSQLVLMYDTSARKFSQELATSIMSGSPEKAMEAISGYTLIRDRKGKALDSKEYFPKEAHHVALLAEKFAEQGGMSPKDALIKAREQVLEIKDEDKKLLSSDFDNLDEFKSIDAMTESARDALGLTSWYLPESMEPSLKLADANMYKKLVKSAYVDNNGNLDKAKEYAAMQINKSYGISTVNGSEEFMFMPPEKRYPGLTTDEIRNQFLNEIPSYLPESALPENARLVATNATVGYGGYDNEGNFVDLTGYFVEYTDPESGLSSLVVDPNTGEVVRWEPSIQDVMESRQFDIEQSNLRKMEEAQRMLDEEDEIARKMYGPEQTETMDEYAGRKLPMAPENIDEVIPVKQSEVQTKMTFNSNNVATAMKRISRGRAKPEIINAINNNQAVLAEAGIDTPARMKAFLSQMNHESGGFSSLVENLKYSSKRLLQVFPKYVKSKAEADYLTRGPDREEKIANKVYGGRMGNNNAGDGYKYRGRGIIQLTGKNNYADMSKKLGIDLVNNPELASDPDIAVKIAARFWKDKNLNELADQGRVKEITRRINGWYKGLADRVHAFERLQDMEL